MATPLACVPLAQQPVDPIVRFKMVPNMDGDVEETGPTTGQIYGWFEADMETQSVEVLMAAVRNSAVLLRQHCAHLLDRYARKYGLTLSVWQEVLRRCNLSPTAGRWLDGSFNMLSLDNKDLLRVYLETPDHHAEIMGWGPPKRSRGRPPLQGGIRKKKRDECSVSTVSLLDEETDTGSAA
jgi:hypothetical protein